MKNKKTKILTYLFTLSILLVPLTKSYADDLTAGHLEFVKVVGGNKFIYNYSILPHGGCSIYTTIHGAGKPLISNGLTIDPQYCSGETETQIHEKIEKVFWDVFFGRIEPTKVVHFSPLIR